MKFNFQNEHFMKNRPKLIFFVLRSVMWKIGLILALTGNIGCYHYTVHAPNYDPDTEYEKKTAHSLFWGLAQKDVSPKNCALTNSLAEVKVTTNLGFAIINVATLGIWCPMTVEWRCAKPCQDDGEL